MAAGQAQEPILLAHDVLVLCVLGPSALLNNFFCCIFVVFVPNHACTGRRTPRTPATVTLAVTCDITPMGHHTVFPPLPSRVALVCLSVRPSFIRFHALSCQIEWPETDLTCLSTKNMPRCASTNHITRLPPSPPRPRPPALRLPLS
jgi:hypothetical protein